MWGQRRTEEDREHVSAGFSLHSKYPQCLFTIHHVSWAQKDLPPFLDTSPRQLFGTFGASRLGQLNREREGEKKKERKEERKEERKKKENFVCMFK